MKIGQRNRAVGATALNERSSHSHSVLTVHVRGKETVSGSILKGCLHLVELAGSERVDKSEAVGERLKEAQHINRSLSALGDVISALAQKSQHIPCRNSKLTQMLQDSLGGHAKTLMFIHINPEVNAIGETISTLKFAERVASMDRRPLDLIKKLEKSEISNLKLNLEKKEAELEQLKSCSSRLTMESQRIRPASPLNMSRYGISASLKPDFSHRPVDDMRSSEARSCSSGKQRKSRIPSKFSDKDGIPKMSFLTEERLLNSSKPRSPSPPVRRSISTDRGTLIRSRFKPDITDNQPFTKPQFPARISVNKSVAAIPVIPSIENNARGCLGPQEVPKQDNISDAFFSLHRGMSKKVQPENEEEQFKQVLNIRQGGIRKTKPEGKVKARNQLPVKIPMSDVSATLFSEMESDGKLEEARKSDFSEPENELGPVVSPVLGNLRAKKLLRNFSRNSQNVELRELAQTMDSFLSGKNEQRVPNGVFRPPKEGVNSAMPEFRRSRSTPRGKFVILP
ncbi:Minus-end-directed kinesin ATPase [Bertholletia excelsa]